MAEDLERFFVPPYVGGRGWLGVRLNRDPDWDEVAAMCTRGVPDGRPEATGGQAGQHP